MNLNGLTLGFYKNKKNVYKLLLLIVICDLFTNAYMSVHERSLISEDSKATMAYFDDSENAIEYLKNIDSSFYRIQKTYAQIDLNDSMFQNYNGEKLYSSILSAEMWNMMELFDLRVKKSNYFYGFDDKQMLRNITAGKYRFTKQEGEYYGYDLIKKIGDIYVYKNENAIDFGVLYDKIVLEDLIVGLDDIQKQILLANYCILENQECDETVQERITNDNFNENLEYDLIYTELKNNEQVYNIDFEQLNNKPLVVEIKGENLEGSIEVYTKESKEAVADTYTYSLTNGEKSII